MFSGQCLKALRKEKKMSQEKLGSLLNISKVAVSNWENGKSFPTLDNLNELAKVLEVDTDYFTEHGEIIRIYSRLNKSNQHKVVNYSSELLEQQNSDDDNIVDLYSYKTYEGLSAGTGYSYFNDGDYTLTYSTENIPHDFASWVVGDSMEPELPNGDVVLIKQSTNLDDGDIYAVEFNEQTYVKKVYRHKTYLRLVSINENYDDIFAPYEENPRIIGKIVGHFTPIEQ
ncbi:XRE family transcriptional regulator [Streptococcus sinensis]|uniref:XRE family transcriptional regulator n=1 Tax=Streptococcus sinensis TaxID=176090 RepID=UPI001F42EE56|nr:S24 family peptidase [Streptococcus sinensis]MCF1284357.1 helix-turn-helix domain-containing protein [Streptococcus sinensis]